MRAAVRHPLAVLALLLPAMVAGQSAEPPTAATGTAEPSPILAAYDFERPMPSGPDTFWLREAEGSVDLSTAFRVGGERSLHLREAAGDGDFSEFLAYFDERREGVVFVQLYLLLTDPDETLNVGLAGRRWFLNPTRHGHAVWIQSGDGELRHRPPEGFRKLCEPRAFTWYFIDLVYDVDRGRYDLAIYEEGIEEPIVDLRGVRSYADSNRSSVRYLSLIGDLEDEDGFDFFVDDLLIATDPAVLQEPFVAPGRRRWFVERLAPRRSELDPAAGVELLRQARQTLRQPFDAAVLESGAPILAELETAADLAFAEGDLNLAAEIYEALGKRREARVRMWLKLADVAYLRGDVEGERRLREAVYGRLELEENR